MRYNWGVRGYQWIGLDWIGEKHFHETLRCEQHSKADENGGFESIINGASSESRCATEADCRLHDSYCNPPTLVMGGRQGKNGKERRRGDDELRTNFSTSMYFRPKSLYVDIFSGGAT